MWQKMLQIGNGGNTPSTKVFLYNKGDFCEDLTGGWIAQAVMNQMAISSGFQASKPIITDKSNSVNVKNGTGSTVPFGIYVINKKISGQYIQQLGLNKLKMEINHIGSWTSHPSRTLFISSSIASGFTPELSANISNGTETKINISKLDYLKSYYIGISASKWASSSTFDIDVLKIYFEQ